MCITHGTQWDLKKNFEKNFEKSCGNKKNNVKQNRRIYIEIEKMIFTIYQLMRIELWPMHMG